VLFAVRQGAGSDGLHHAIADQHIAVIDYPVGKDDHSRKYLVSHRCLLVARQIRRADGDQSSAAAPLHPT
jgi:hypothetical protein